MKKLVLFAVIAAAGVAAWRWQRAPEAHEGNLVTDRLWIDHIPRSQREIVNAMVMVSDQSVGAFNAASRWRGQYELFGYEQKGNELRFVFPQTGDRDSVRVRARRCNEGGFDFCLELDGSSRGVKRYYSMKGWEIGRLDQEQALIDRIEAQAAR